MQKPLLSVSIITYNHEKYIRQCLQSVVDQQTNFPFEVIIGEDCSTDGTRAIIKEFEQRYPDIMRPIYHDKNVGMMRNGFEFNHNAIRGKYVACLEGDDYWTDPLKLQTQVDFLENNPRFSACFHDCEIVNEKDDVIGAVKSDKQVYTINDLLKPHSWVVMTGSIVLRKDSNDPNPDWIFKIKNGDFALQLLLADRGDFYGIKKVMSRYRRHTAGFSQVFYDNPGLHEKNLIELVRYFDEETKARYHQQIETYISQLKKGMLEKLESKFWLKHRKLNHIKDFLQHRLGISIAPFLLRSTTNEVEQF